MYRLPIRDCLSTAGFFSNCGQQHAGLRNVFAPLRGGSHSCFSAKISRGKLQHPQRRVDQTPDEGRDDHVFHGVLGRVTLNHRPLHPVLRHEPIEDAGQNGCQRQGQIQDAGQGR